MRKLLWLCLFNLVLSATGTLNGCGCSGSMGGVEAGNPPDVVRPVMGQLTSSIIDSASCPADTVVAVNALAEETLVEVGDDCSFMINLTVDEAYLIQLYLEDQLVASLSFTNGPDAEPSSVMIVSEGDDPIDLGSIDLGESTVTPENEPATQNDQDADGRSDYIDGDDDNDETPDSLEGDCDGDGFPDDYDENNALCNAVN